MAINLNKVFGRKAVEKKDLWQGKERGEIESEFLEIAEAEKLMRAVLWHRTHNPTKYSSIADQIIQEYEKEKNRSVQA